MIRGIDDRNILDKFIEDFAQVLERHCKYIVVSGFVAIAHGRTRATEDIDVIVERLSKEDFEKLFNDLIKSGFECMQSSDPIKVYSDYLNQDTSVRFTNRENFLPPEAELKFAKDELDNLQLNNRRKLPFTRLDIWFSSVESNIAFKEEFLKSDKDIEDARHLRLVCKGEIDEKEINRIKSLIKKLRLNK